MPELTYKQRLFVDFYLGESQGNALDAARRAGYRSPHPDGSRTLQKATVRAAIETRLESSAMSSKEVLARLSEIAATDLGDFLKIDRAGNWTVDMGQAKRRDKLRLVKRLRNRRSTETTGKGAKAKSVVIDNIDLELRDALAALTTLAKFHGLLNREPDAQIDLGKMLDESDRITVEFDREREKANETNAKQ